VCSNSASQVSKDRETDMKARVLHKQPVRELKGVFLPPANSLYFTKPKNGDIRICKLNLDLMIFLDSEFKTLEEIMLRSTSAEAIYEGDKLELEF
jgi:hypothetical protein